MQSERTIEQRAIEMELLLLDACVLINLMVSRIPMPELASASSMGFAVVEEVANEIGYLRNASGVESPVEKQFLMRANKIEVLSLRQQENAGLVRFAALVDDGEAATLALAEARSLPVATDDRKARRVAREFCSTIELESTSSILRRWSAEVEPGRIAEALLRICTEASYIPPRDDPNHGWWSEALGRCSTSTVKLAP